MSQIFILEGPDGSGKSTFAEKLMDQFPGAAFLKFSNPATDAEAYAYHQRYASELKHAAGYHNVIVMHRAWYSDLVYGPVCRGRDEMLVDNKENLELMVKALGGGIVFYFTAKLDVLWARCKRKGEIFVTDKAMLSLLRDKYEDVMNQKMYLPLVRVDTTNKGR